ncbi:hypothetical protein QGP82_23760 [Leptothoe sp. LEGE 181152]|nr:hypothetical protein [Leptothoe sp. LEGE 181152]
MKSLYAVLSELSNLEQTIRDDGPVAPANCWIDTYSPNSRATVYARLRCDRVLANGKRTMSLGRTGSHNHRDWQKRIQRRNALQELRRRTAVMQQLIDAPPIWQLQP